MADEVKFDPELRKRFSKVRPTVKETIQTALQSGSKLNEIRTLRKGAAIAAEIKNKELEVSEIKREEAEKKSVEDELTGLLNRRGWDQELSRISALSERQNIPFSLLYLDLDSMKYTNDTYGHAVGDELLKKSARIIEEQIRKADIAGRIGGDEFAIILTGTSKIYAEQVAEKIRRAFETKLLGQMSHLMRDTDFPLTVSIGFTSYPHISNTVEDLKKEADKALYASKKPTDGQKPKNRVTFYTEDLSVPTYTTTITEPERS